MATTCGECNREIDEAAKFCKYCGAAVAVEVLPRVVGEAPEEPTIDQVLHYCERCGTALIGPAEFCKRCGTPVPGAARVGARELPPRELRRPTEERALPRRLPAMVGPGSIVAGIGGALALVGCFVPLATGAGENISIIPHMTSETEYALIAPASCAALVVIALLTLAGGREQRVMLGGVVIALSSPWVVLWTLSMLATARVIAGLGPFSGDATIGPGWVALSAGFWAGLVGGFVILWESVRARQRSARSSEAEGDTD